MRNILGKPCDVIFQYGYCMSGHWRKILPWFFGGFDSAAAVYCHFISSSLLQNLLAAQRDASEVSEQAEHFTRQRTTHFTPQ